LGKGEKSEKVFVVFGSPGFLPAGSLLPPGDYVVSYPGRKYDLRHVIFSTVPGQEGGKNISGHGVLTWLDGKEFSRCLGKKDREKIMEKPLWVFKEVFGPMGRALFWGEIEMNIEGSFVSFLEVDGDQLVHRRLSLDFKFGRDRPILKYPVQ
jgi:hypothetical protein